MRIATESDEQNDWDLNFKKLERDINLTVNKSTGRTPNEALYGYLPRFEDAKTRAVTANCEKYHFPTEVQREIRERILQAQKVYK